MDEEQRNPLKQFVGAIGGGLSKERRDELYYGRPPKGTYFGRTDLRTIHDLRMSPSQIRRLYGIGGKEETVGEVIESRLGTDSKADLIRELVENTSLTRSEAEALVSRWMAVNNLTEYEDEVIGRYIAPRGLRR